MTTSINSQEPAYKKPNAGVCIGGAAAGAVTNSAVASLINSARPQIINKLAKINESLTADEFSAVEKAAVETIENSGLAKKGVAIIKATTQNTEEIAEILKKELDNQFPAKHLPGIIKKKFVSMMTYMFCSGKNAAYTFNAKKIIMPEEKLSLAFFHEAGHAANANLSKIGKMLQKCRPLPLLATLIGLIALLKTKNAPNQQPKTKTGKTTTFIKENAGKLTFAAFLPVLIEEGMASIKGNKFAKKLLSPDLVKKVSKISAMAFLTYVATAASLSLGIYAGVKVKDAIAKPKLVEQNNKEPKT